MTAEEAIETMHQWERDTEEALPYRGEIDDFIRAQAAKIAELEKENDDLREEINTMGRID